MEEVAGIHLALGHFGAGVVRLSNDRARDDARAAEADGPGFAPVVAAVEVIDVRRAAKFGEHDDERMFHQPACGEVFDERGEGFIKVAQLLEVEIEVLVVRVVVGMRHVHAGDALLDEPACEQAVAAKVGVAVAGAVLVRLFGNVENFALTHQFLRLLERLRPGLCLRRAAAQREAVVHFAPQVVGAHGGILRETFRALHVLRRLAVAQRDAGILGTEISGVRAAPATTAGGDDNVPGERAICGIERLRGDGAEFRVHHARARAASGGHEIVTIAVIVLVRVDAANEREVVHLLRRVRQEFTNLDARRGSGNGAERAAGGGAGLRIPAFQLTESAGHAHDEKALLFAL